MKSRLSCARFVLGTFGLAAASMLTGACTPQSDVGGGKGGTSGSAGTTGSAGSSAGTTGTAGTTVSGAAGTSSTGSGGTADPSGGTSGGTGGTASGTGGSVAGTSGSGTAGTSAGGKGGTAGAGTGAAGATGGAGAARPLPDPGSDGDGDSMVGPNYTTQSDLSSHGNPKGKNFKFSMTIANSTIFNGKDSTVSPSKVNTTREIDVYVPAMYKDGDPAAVLIIQDGPGEIGQVSNALDNLTISTDPMKKLPPFVVVAVQNGGNDSIGSERGLEYDTLSDRYARFIDQEVLPAVIANAQVKAAYPNLKFTKDPSGRGTLGCSSGGAAAFTMGWFRPDLFSRVIGYSTTLVAQQDPKAPESQMYPLGAWDYHSDKQIIKNDTTGREKLLRIFINANQNDLNSGANHMWLMANQLTAAALKAKGFHYKFIEGMGVGHCDGSVQSATLAGALSWVWRGYQPSGL